MTTLPLRPVLIGRALLAVASLSLLTSLLSSCGGGGGGSESSGNERSIEVTAGTSTVVDYSDASGPGDGGGSAAGDGGPGLGRFKNALVSVELADGRVAGEAEVDALRGVVHVNLLGYSGPVRFTVKAKDDGSSTYYEESRQKFVTFPPRTVMNAVVPRFDKNVGITILTEAAWRYLDKTYGPNGWKTAANVTEANNKVRDEFNKYLPAAYQVNDITRLPYLLSDTTAPGSIPATDNGNYGIVISGLGVAAGLFQPDDSAPALRMLSQMADDFCDGVLDGVCKGAPVSPGPAEDAYRVSQLSSMLATGIDRVVAACGNDALRERMTTPRILQVRVDATRDPFARRSYTDNTPIWLLRNDGQVLFWSTRATNPTPYTSTLLFRQLYEQGPLLGTSFSARTYDANYRINDTALPRDQQVGLPLAPKEFAAYRDVDMLEALDLTVFDANTLGLGQIVRKQDTGAYEETEINGLTSGTLLDSGLRRVADIGVAGYNRTVDGQANPTGGRAFYAVNDLGAVFAWGSNSNMQLGIGNRDTALIAGKPVQIPNFTARSVTGHLLGAYAIDVEGLAYYWGREVPGANSDSQTVPSPTRVTLLNTFAPFAELACAEVYKCIARTLSGNVIVFGMFFDQPVDMIGQLPTATQVPPTMVSLPSDRTAVAVGAAGLNVYALLNNGDVLVLPTLPDKPQVIPIPPELFDARSTGGMCSAQP
jgi:hypothetical protein